MNLSVYDWAMVILAVVALRLVSLSTRKHMKGVADFLSANRSAGRYLLTIAGQMGTTGAISVVAAFEMYYDAGLSPIWWSLMLIPVSIIATLTGWIYYRFRETRALTLAQFLEMRYSRRFRIFSGFLVWSCGILNFGIFPAVTARFFMYFCGLPEHFQIPGLSLDLSTFAAIMILDLALALTFVNMGGQISVMVTECVQGIFTTAAFVIIMGWVLLEFQWPMIIKALSHAPANASMIHPFHTGGVKDFNPWYFIIGFVGQFYTYMSWQGTSGFNSSARTPHEQKMGAVISLWRSMPQFGMILILPLAALVILRLPQFADQAATINATLATIENPAVRHQMSVPIALAHILPIGIKGLFVTIMLFFSFTCHDTYMHSWGSIFIQDVVMPLRKRPLEPQQHIRLLRYSIMGVAAFAFLFSLFYPQSQKIYLFQATTGTIWLGGSGAVIAGGLYWRRGTTSGAYAALITGSALGVSGLFVPRMYQAYTHHEFPINGQWLWFIAMIAATIIYVAVSYMTSRRRSAFDLERMLHRGKHAVKSHGQVQEAMLSPWQKVVGITKEFSFTDKLLAIALIVWNAGWFTFFVIVGILNLIVPFTDEWWSNFWHVYVWMYFVIGVPTTFWFGVGGLKDIRALFKTLETSVRDHTDDGRVIREEEVVVVK